MTKPIDFDRSPTADVDELRAHIDARFDALRAELADIKRLIPNAFFLARSERAQELIEMMRRDEARSHGDRYKEAIRVPQDPPGLLPSRRNRDVP